MRCSMGCGKCGTFDGHQMRLFQAFGEVTTEAPAQIAPERCTNTSDEEIILAIHCVIGFTCLRISFQGYRQRK
jgi:hypothetical protein